MKFSRRHFLGALGGAALPAFVRAASDELRPDMAEFAARVSEANKLDEGRVRAVLSEAEFQPAILRAMAAPGTARPWRDFRSSYLNHTRIDGGVRFWTENEDVVARASAFYEVAQEVIVAILGVETVYGRVTGNYRVLDALATLSFEREARSDYFQRELEQFLLLVHDGILDHTTVKGSYAGAMGWPQFMPTSMRTYAVDFDRDGRIDLWNSPADIVASVGNYFQTFGWKHGADVALRASVTDPQAAADLVSAGIKPAANQAQLASGGVQPERPLGDGELGALMMFEGDSGPEYWLGLDNFYVITRYNRSQNYALAVWQLAEAIRDKKGGAKA